MNDGDAISILWLKLNSQKKMKFNSILHCPLCLTWIFCKYSRKGSSQFQKGTNFIVSMHLECKIKEFKTNFMTLVQGVFEI